MWDRLKPTDIEQAKQALQARRAEILRRQQQELDGLDSDQAEIDSLDRLADRFLRKYRRAAEPAPARAPAPAAAPVPPPRVAAKAAPPAMPQFSGKTKTPPAEVIAARREGDRGDTNFDVFSRAVSKATF